MVLVSSGGDGVLRVWIVQAFGHLMCTLPGAVGHLETVKDICVDEDYGRMVLGDSSGHVRMWDVSELDTSSRESLSASFKQVNSTYLRFILVERNQNGISGHVRSQAALQGADASFTTIAVLACKIVHCIQVLHFRGNESAVNGITCVSGQELLLVSSADTCVHMFNYDGGLVGTFGVHLWVLDDVSTHQDPEAQNTLPVLNVIESLCKVAAARKEVAGTSFHPFTMY